MMECPACGYVFGPLETECPRCARRAAQPCGNCGRPGVAGQCQECGREICSACSVAVGEARLCPVCAPANLAARHSAELTAAASARPLPGPGFVAQPALPGDDGLWGNARRGFRFMQESLAMGFRDRELLTPSLLSLVCSIAMLGSLILVMKYRHSGGSFLEEHPFIASQIAIAVLAMVLGWCTTLYFINYFFMGMTVHLVNLHLHGREAQLGSAFRDAVRNSLALLLLAGVSVVVSLATALIRALTGWMRGLREAGDIAASAADRVWTVVVCLLLPIIMLEDVSLGKAVERAREIHARNLIPIALAEVGVGVTSGIIALPLVLVAYWAVHYARVSAPSLVTPTLVGVGILLALLVAFTGFVRTAYYTCLYLWALERAEARETAAIPRPLAAALGA